MPKDTSSMNLALRAATAFAVVLTAACGGPEYPNCENDDNCHQGEFCVNGMCQMCRDDADCGAGRSCVGGRCDAIPGYCAAEGDCPSGQECRANRCVAMASVDQPLADTPPAPPGPCEVRPVLFEFESNDLTDGARNQIQANAACLRERNVTRVHIVGMADPRGTEEYNLALGDRRARSVKRYLASLGFPGNQISVASVGEEMARGTDESSWAQDRRADFELR